MTGRRLAALLLAAVLSGPATAALEPDQRVQLLSEAQTAYAAGIAVLRSDPLAAAEAFDTAARRYQQLVDDGIVNGRLLYNLGNAWLQKGDVGRAILAYRGAERLVPSDPRLEHNLAYARSLRRDRIEQSGGRQLASALLAWRNAVPARTRFAIFAAAWTALWAALLARAVWRPRGGRWVVVGLAAVSLVTGLSAGAELLADDRGGVLLADEVIVRKGNGEGFAPRFEEPLHAGVEFRLLERRADWLLVELANGRSGWVRTDQAGLVE